MTRPTVFISYSHKDETWKDRLRPHLEVLEQVGQIAIWDDRQIDPGGEWFTEIQQIMAEAAVALCLISADYLTSDFVTREEIPYLLERRERDGMVLIPVLLRPCPWQAVPWLKAIQMLPRNGQAVSRDFNDDWDTPFSEVAERISAILTDPAYTPPQPPPPRWTPPDKIDIERMPQTGAELFGRKKMLELLDEAWESETTHLVSLVAWGGMGKSTLVNRWLARMADDNYRGARRVFAWSFYSQGTSETVTSADLFIAEALAWFGDPDPTAGSPWHKGERLAELIRREKTLLILDGLEPLQSPHEFERGKVQDPALGILLAELARANPGLGLITTREPVADLAPYAETTREEDLQQISAAAGRALLRVGGVRGTDAELEDATRAFGQHALALKLLAAYLHDIPGHHISNTAAIPDLDVPVEQGKHPRRVMAAFAQRFGEGPEVELLRVLGLFDRPAEAAALAALRKAPPIPDLTTHLQPLSEAEWLRLLQTLRAVRLLAPESRHRPGDLDAHPLVREHFGQQLQDDYPDAWREGNNRLYEYFKGAAKELPDTLAEMAPLFAAVAHGCAAGRHQEALNEVYWPRISREREAFVVDKLGGFGADLAALAGFFNPPWRHPVAELVNAAQALVQGLAGYTMYALGRLAEAAQPLQDCLEAAIAGEDWTNAAVAAGVLSELYLTLGDLTDALDYAQKRVDLADRSQDTFQRTYSRTSIGDVLHLAGRLDEAASIFQVAETLRKEHQPEYPLLYSLQGFRYCDLLLDQGEHRAVRERAEKSFEGRVPSDSLLTIALDHLSLGRANLLAAQANGGGDFSRAAHHLDQAVDGLRRAGTQNHLPRGLLARAALHRVTGAFALARRDLAEARSIVERGSMRLYLADAHLEAARLHLAQGEKDQAREHLARAREMIQEMGYHRRDAEVAELGAQL